MHSQSHYIYNNDNEKHLLSICVNYANTGTEMRQELFRLLKSILERNYDLCVSCVERNV